LQFNYQPGYRCIRLRRMERKVRTAQSNAPANRRVPSASGGSGTDRATENYCPDLTVGVKVKT